MTPIFMKKRKIIIIVCLYVIVFIGGFFYFKNSSSGKKIEVNVPKAIIDNLTPEVTDNTDNNVNQQNSGAVQSENSAVETKNLEVKKNTPDAPIDSGAKESPKVDSPKFKIIDRLVSFGFQKSVERKIDTLIVHSSYDAIGDDGYSVSGVIAEYKSYGVSPHFLIDRAGQVYRLVTEQNIAYHAGESQMPDGRTGVNAFSLGVEMLTTKADKLTQAQYDSLNALIVYLKGRYKITNILGHNQIAPGRKDDPWNFEWSKVKK